MEKMAVHSAYDLFSWFKYRTVNLVFPTLIFGVGVDFLYPPPPQNEVLGGYTVFSLSVIP